MERHKQQELKFAAIEKLYDFATNTQQTVAMEKSIIEALEPCLEKQPEHHARISNEIKAAQFLVTVCQKGLLGELLLENIRFNSEGKRYTQSEALQGVLREHGVDCQPARDYHGEIARAKRGSRVTRFVKNTANALTLLPLPLVATSGSYLDNTREANIARHEAQNLPPGAPERKGLEEQAIKAEDAAESVAPWLIGAMTLAIMGTLMRGLTVDQGYLLGQKRKMKKNVSALEGEQSAFERQINQFLSDRHVQDEDIQGIRDMIKSTQVYLSKVAKADQGIASR